uniref:hypothetical protein n=1 Tax=Microbacterium proteolyticum TaxID=1572644 RepID=UPI002417539D|nr:hypothetical protein [Microbacterium proteolyticum]
MSPTVEAAVSAATVANAGTVGAFTNRTARADGLTGDLLNPRAFAGVTGSGVALAQSLRGGIITAKQALAGGASLADAMMAGGTYLTLLVKTAVADVERSSSVAAATGKGYVRYVRLVNPGACSRCAILAGSDRYRSNFQRHPACRCSTVPVKGMSIPDGLHASPMDHFWSLSPAEQERVYTKSGAEAIHAGADPIKVVNARRGSTRVRLDRVVQYGPARIQRSVIGRNADGTPVLGYATVEGKTRLGKRLNGVQRPRLMPETIVDLTDDVEMRRVLLRDAGYLTSPAQPRELFRQQESDRQEADAFYRSKGIFVG